MLIAGGGTGGHTLSGMALAEEILRRGDAVAFAASDRPVDREILDHARFPALFMDLPRRIRGPADVFRAPWKWGRGYSRIRRFLREWKPDVVVGVGGYVAAPALLAARRSGVPLVLVEQNVIPGRVNRWFSRAARRICVSFPESMEYFKRDGDRVVVTGNPLRREILAPSGGLSLEGLAEGVPLVLVTGGSQGARFLNGIMPRVCADLKRRGMEFQVFHLAGDREAAAVGEHYRGGNIRAVVLPFFREMAAAYRRSAAAVSRAGATTLAEIAAAGLPAVLVPFPHAADNHQAANARCFAARGACRVVEEGPGAGEALGEALAGILENPDEARRMREALRSMARPEAAAAVAAAIHEVVEALS
ncbi:MAG: undecaprenyldiphospho-muramoylpentapeptide beta-N-acetylglucosaminyltransferase [Planctomycetota bacterium]